MYLSRFAPVSQSVASRMAEVFSKTPVGWLGGYPLSFDSHFQLYAVICGVQRPFCRY